LDAVLVGVDDWEVIEQRVHGHRHQAGRHEEDVPSVQVRTGGVQAPLGGGLLLGCSGIFLQGRPRQALELQGLSNSVQRALLPAPAKGGSAGVVAERGGVVQEDVCVGVVGVAGG